MALSDVGTRLSETGTAFYVTLEEDGDVVSMIFFTPSRAATCKSLVRAGVVIRLNEPRE